MQISTKGRYALRLMLDLASSIIQENWSRSKIISARENNFKEKISGNRLIFNLLKEGGIM